MEDAEEMTDREIILDSLMEILEKGQYSHLVLRSVLQKYDYLPKQQRSFIKRTCEGTIENKIYIDYVIDSFAKTKTPKMKPFIRTLLRMGTYQILFLDGVPDAAVCNECVKLATKRGFGPLKGFVNGILRTIARNKEQIALPDREKEPLMYLSVRYSMPLWIVELWQAQYGSRAEDMLKAQLEKRPLTIRVNEAMPGEAQSRMLSQIAETGVKVTQSKQLPYAYYLEQVDHIDALPGYAQGSFFMQDIGSMQVVELAGIKPGDAVIDVCAAPGGKAMHALAKLHGKGSVQARDLTENKVSMIEENIERCAGAADAIEVLVWDARILDPQAVEKADVVIADLPCSGLGVIGRKSDIKYRMTPEQVADIAALQREILSVVWQYVKPGGILMYSTCTLTKAENQDNRDWFLKNSPFTLLEEKELLPSAETDGFYMIKCRRNKA